MKKLILAVLLVSCAAFAGEKWLGNTYSTDAGTSNNQWVGPPWNTFGVPQGSALTVQCDQDSFVMVGVPVVDGGSSMKILSGSAMTTSCSSFQGSGYALQDAGVYSGCLVSSQPLSGATGLCHWYSRAGNEGF